MRAGPLLIFLLVAVVLSTAQAAGKSFKDYKLIRITPQTYEQVVYLRELWLSGSPYELDFWQPPSHVGALVDIVVSPANAEAFVGDIRAKGLSYIVAIKDLEQAIRNETRSDTPDGVQWDPSVYRFDKYNRLAQIESYLKKLQADNPDRVSLITIGQTHEKRNLTVVKLSGRHAFGDKPAIWIDGGIHAREWIAPATVLYFIRQLDSLYDSDPVIQSMLDQLDWYILPVMNPDGYEFSHTECKQSFFRTVCCHGVDLNRNFDWFWASTGSSSDPCHETYHGPASFSEPESAAVRDFVTKLGDRVKGFVTLHSYSQMWIIPYGHRRRAYPQDYTSALKQAFNLQKPLATRAINALKVMHGTQYTVGTGADIMYEAAGGSADWAKGRAKIPYSYLIELRPKNVAFANGFLLPENAIVPTAEETWEAIKVVADELIGQFGMPIILNKLGGVHTIPTIAPSDIRRKPTENPEESGIFVMTSTTTTTTMTSTTATTNVPTTFVEELTVATELPTTTTFETTTVDPCSDFSKWCHWWRTFGMCARDRVSSLCPRSCDPACQAR